MIVGFKEVLFARSCCRRDIVCFGSTCFDEEIYLRGLKIFPYDQCQVLYIEKSVIVVMRAFVDNFDQSFCGSDFWNFSRRSVFLAVDPDVFKKLSYYMGGTFTINKYVNKFLFF